jgi:hypothetical protein
MTATEITEGLARLGVMHQTTLPYSPYQNAKIEVLWASVEGRLMAMLEGVEDLALGQLNEATQAWVEYEYNRRVHSETGEAPITRFLAGPSVMRPCLDSAALRLAFTRSDRRMLRKSDGTIVIEGRRFEVPNRYRHLPSLEVRFASWDLSQVHLVDEHTGAVLCRFVPPGQGQQRQRPAPGAGAHRHRARRRQTGGRHGAIARQNDASSRRHRPGPGLSRQRNRPRVSPLRTECLHLVSRFIRREQE